MLTVTEWDNADDLSQIITVDNDGFDAVDGKPAQLNIKNYFEGVKFDSDDVREQEKVINKYINFCKIYNKYKLNIADDDTEDMTKEYMNEWKSKSSDMSLPQILVKIGNKVVDYMSNYGDFGQMFNCAIKVVLKLCLIFI